MHRVRFEEGDRINISGLLEYMDHLGLLSHCTREILNPLGGSLIDFGGGHQPPFRFDHKWYLVNTMDFPVETVFG